MKFEKKYIYDFKTRILHATIGISVILLIITAELSKQFFENGHIRHVFLNIHIFLGYLLSIAFFFRFILFFSSNQFSNWRSFLHFKIWYEILKNKKINNIKWGWGHHPLASLLYLIVYALILTSVITGLFLARIQFDMGPISSSLYDELEYLILLKNIHNFSNQGIIIFILFHLYGLTMHTIREELPIYQSMRTGFQYKKREEK